MVVELDGQRLVTDPLLGRGLLGVLRRTGPGPEVIGTPTAILVSHLHLDHLDFPSLRALGREIPILGPPDSRRYIGRRGHREVRELAEGQSAEVGALRVKAVEARHSGARVFGHGPGGSVGYLIEGSQHVYFAGDTDLFDGMRSLGPVDVALVPVWGWGPRLGPGHLDPESAAEAVARISPRVAIPIHWGALAPIGARRLWPWMLSRPAEEFVAHTRRRAPGVEVRVLRPGEATVVATS